MTKKSSADRAFELVHAMVISLIDATDQCSIVVSVDGDNRDQIKVDVMVLQSDIGKIIGKQGRTARSMRTVIGGFAMREKVRVALNIVEHKPA